MALTRYTDPSIAPASVWRCAEARPFANIRVAEMTISAIVMGVTEPRPLVILTSVFQKSTLR